MIMINTWVAIDENGIISAASTTSPDQISGENVPNYQYEFELTWEQIEELWRYKVVNGELVLREDL
jgi:hypothetical protein